MGRAQLEGLEDLGLRKMTYHEVQQHSIPLAPHLLGGEFPGHLDMD